VSGLYQESSALAVSSGPLSQRMNRALADEAFQRGDGGAAAPNAPRGGMRPPLPVVALAPRSSPILYPGWRHNGEAGELG
jgi:hypothetical protein